jgi:hypothetical protein
MAALAYQDQSNIMSTIKSQTNPNQIMKAIQLIWSQQSTIEPVMMQVIMPIEPGNSWIVLIIRFSVALPIGESTVIVNTSSGETNKGVTMIAVMLKPNAVLI